MENAVVKKIREAIKKEYPKAFQFKSHGGMYQRSGLPDIICSINGIFVGIEVKDVGKENTLTKIQQHNLDVINESGGIAFMSSSATHTIKELKRRIKKWEINI
jgi:hypothetical protein